MNWLLQPVTVGFAITYEITPAPPEHLALPRMQAPPPPYPPSGPNTAGDAFVLWGNSVWRMLRYLGVPRDQLKDATQEVFAIAHEKWATILDESARKAWIFGIARLVAYKYGRKAKRARLTISDDADAELELLETGEASCPAALAADRELVRFLSCTLEQLSEDERLLVALTKIEDCSVREAAELLKLPERRASWLLEKAMKRLKDALTRRDK